ncbi:TonB-dependent siderophore receptor [Halomonas sp. McH1-25]|uniref:TonB-dependent siderophore receptor n=1 Tax=unclassified Halomonas TaxID=2609666 RepID=UPI001EF6AF68|nr:MULTISPECIES: TonB-dependent siderophore receptor [unclassified Halomonas]MCG7600587.1 TonB-dependent siderophore receptor [Halomonas sp. McH1-25]MCP1343210.1 TonB-dependent siderophore receptor [Halomonas sp. FL8]MCP1359906.1 TonB-dependent siderophore receptor [Halomonas sp. BBD45]
MPNPTFAPRPDQRLAQAIRRCLGLSLSGALITMPLAALAQEDAVSASEADTMVVLGTALKVDTPALETPRATSLVTNEQMQKRDVSKLDEAFQYRSGVVSQPYGSDNNADWLFLRGFSAEASTYQDGLRLFRTGGYFWWMMEPFGLERVELLKGPASILYGEAPPGGVINAISKRPTEEEQGLFEVEVGSDEHRQVGLDVSGPVTDKEDMRYRVVGMYREQDGELDGTYKDRYYFAPSLSVDFSDDTTVTFLASIQKDDGVPTTAFFPAYGTIEGTPFGKVDPSTNLGEPDYDRIDQEQFSLGYALEHQINDTWEFHQNFRYSHLDMDLRSAYAFPSNDSRVVARGIVYRDGEYDAYTVDNQFVARTYGDSYENTFLVGLDYQDLNLDYDDGDSFSFGTIDIFDPVYGNYTPVSESALTEHDVDKEQLGFYAQNQLRLNGNWIFLVGARHDSVESSDETSSSSTGYDDEQLSLTAGVMYLADNGLSPYVSYSESFTPLASSDASGNAYEPLEGEQIEVGVKYAPSWFDGYVTAAAFKLKETNSLITTDAGPQRQIGERESTGFEIEGVGYLTDNLQLTASYTYTDTRIDVSESQQDERAPFIPYHMASAWLDYGFDEGALSGVTLGGGVRYVGETANSPGTGVDRTVPSYTLYDAMVSYEFGTNWMAQINANNLTDEEYISGCDYYCYYGESRSVVGSLRYRW